MRQAHAPQVFCLVATLLLGAAQASAQAAPRIDVQVDRNVVQAGEAFSVTINVDSRSSDEPDVRLPTFAGLRILSRSESHPMSLSFSFGLGSGGTRTVSRQSTYELVVVADRPGEYRIDPVVVTLGGKQYKSAVRTIRVVGSGANDKAEADAPPDSPGVDASPVSPGDLTAQDLAGAKVDPDYFVQTQLSKTKAVVGERLVLTVYAYFSRNVSGVDLVREPGTEGFWVENLVPTGARPQVEQVSIGGVSYGRIAERRIALFPVEPGKITIAPAVAEYTIQKGFFSAPRTVRRSSVPVTVEVLPTPSEEQPAGFLPANVGRYTFTAEVDRREVKVGEPVTLTMTVKGEGNVRNVVLPELGEIAGFKTYAPELEADVRTEGEAVLGSRTSKILLIAKEAGEFTLPALSFSFFDPEAGKYVTNSLPARTLTVLPGAAVAPPAAESTSASQAEPISSSGLERLNRQLRSVESRVDFEAAAPGDAARSPWFFLLALGVPLSYAGFLAVTFARRRRAASWAKDRSKRADGEALRRLTELASHKEPRSSDAFFSELARILLRFLESRLEAPVSGDTLPELRDRLVGRGISGDLADRVIAEMESLDFARFARATGGDDERDASLDRLRQLIRELASVRIPKAGGPT